jgi:DNA-binding transcriptional ArsR family regulator
LENQNLYRNIAIIMGLSKSEEFSVRDNKLAAYAKALAHPARIAILQLLIKKQSCICGDLVDELPLSQSTVSQHLKELKAAGLIKGDIEGAKTCYCIDEKEWENAKTVLNHLFQSYQVQKMKCC